MRKPEGGSKRDVGCRMSGAGNVIPQSEIRNPQSEAGQIHFLFIFGALALACVAFLVFNTGTAAARRMRLQNGADAAAHAAAAWTARGLNLLSANNVATTQLIAMVVLIDSLDAYTDLAIPIARVQQDSWHRLRWANWPTLVFDAHRGHQRAIREEAFLSVLAQIADAMVATFHPAEPDHPDSLWQMMYMLEAMSDAVVDATPIMAAERAATMGKVHEAEGAFAWPYYRPLPVVKGRWADFREPTLVGTPRGWPIPPPPMRGYHMMYGEYNQGPLRILGRSARWMLWTAGGEDGPRGYSSATTRHLSFGTISNTKFSLLFDGRDKAAFQYREQFAGFPPPPQADRTHWWMMDVHSLQPFPGIIIQPMNYPAYANAGITYVPLPLVWHLAKYANRQPVFENPTQAGNWTPGLPFFRPLSGAQNSWEDYRPFQMDFYPDLGIGQWGPGNIPIPGPITTIFHQERYVFAHSSRQASRDFFNPVYQRPVMPRPYLLDSSWPPPGDSGGDAWMEDQQSWLGFAWRSGRSEVWPQWFINPVPGEQMVAVARARIYNPTAWDLFTQNWRVVMVPVGSMREWLDDAAGAPPPILAGIVNDQDVEPVRRFFRAVPPDLHDALVTH